MSRVVDIGIQFPFNRTSTTRKSKPLWNIHVVATCIWQFLIDTNCQWFKAEVAYSVTIIFIQGFNMSRIRRLRRRQLSLLWTTRHDTGNHRCTPVSLQIIIEDDTSINHIGEAYRPNIVQWIDHTICQRTRVDASDVFSPGDRFDFILNHQGLGDYTRC